MSVGFNPKNELILDRELKVQELAVSRLDYGLYSTAPGAPIITSDPYMGVAGGYGILAAVAITNSVGTSVVTGNLGESPGSTVTGSFTVSGSTDLGNAAALAAQNAASSAFTALQTLGLAGTTIPSELGGQTLNSPVAGATVAFQFASGSAGISLTSGHSTLTLNGPGRFVIYTASTLLTGASGSTDLPVIDLTGGALAKNVYFVVGSSATINQSVASTGAVFNGNIIANTSITVTQSATINGSLIALNAAITVSNISTIIAISGSTSSPSTDLTIYVREPVKKVSNAFCKVDASNTMYDFNQAEIVIVDDQLLQISSISAANPSVITTSYPHNMITGQIVYITNSNSTPSINSYQQVIVLSPTTFSIPVNVTVSGNQGYVDRKYPVSDAGAIRLLGLPGSAFNANDLAVVKYIVSEPTDPANRNV